MNEVRCFRAPVGGAKEAVEGFLWLEAESFADYGEWRLDTQFTHKMGSAYLLAAGVLKPIKPATTSVSFPKAGVWRAWARTKDWLPEYHPGRFRLSVAGKPGRELGAGPGGLGAAIAAARHGARVALVHDRPVLGGNASSEIGVPTDGAAVSHPDAREGGICEEANLRRMVLPDYSISQAFRKMADALPNLTVFDNQRVVGVRMDGARIASVEARCTLDGTRRRWGGCLFVDCTGDGWVGVFAGAKRMYGREAAADTYFDFPVR